MKKRFLAVFVSVMMLFGSFSAVSFADNYKEKYDVNGDNYVNPLDALEILKKSVSGSTDATFDVNGDGYVNPLDALVILKFSVYGETSEPGSDTPDPDFESEVVRLVNIERTKNGLPELVQDEELGKATDIRAKEIGTVFSHTRPDGSSCFTVFEELEIEYGWAGENIAYGYRTPAEVVEGWMNSTGHRANILSENYTKIGVGFDNYNWVQLFTS